jgi:hypothetical protein
MAANAFPGSRGRGRCWLTVGIAIADMVEIMKKSSTPTPTLHVEGLGPIQEADVTFGDLTVLVGPQATGKSIFLQTLKLLIDSKPIQATMQRYGLSPDPKPGTRIEAYFGAGMASVWSEAISKVTWQGKAIELSSLIGPPKGRPAKNVPEEQVFLIPAQRILAIDRAGWIRGFSDYSAGDPFVVRDFSEKVRRQMDDGPGTSSDVFPMKGRLKSEVRDMLKTAVFGDYELKVEKLGIQKRFVLRKSEADDPLPFMVWSAGQREFVPLLLGLYWLLPSSAVTRRDSIQWVLIEELEMGLHPKGIEALLVTVVDLMQRGYRVCLSTHSPTVLDFVWALKNLQDAKADAGAVLKMLSLPSKGPTREMANTVLQKDLRVYAFSRRTGKVADISSLDAGSENDLEANWGGLAEFGSRAANIVADAVAEDGRE